MIPGVRAAQRLRHATERLFLFCLVATLTLLCPASVHALPFKAERARLAIVELRLDDAAKILEGAEDEADVAMELARLALYRGDCDRSLAILERPYLEEQDDHAGLLGVAKGCARATAGTLIRRDDERGIVVRFQDDDDIALFPIIADAAVAQRDMLARELGTRLPDPMWIDVVRDQFSLAAMTGLPEEAAKTTGTVAVAKWGRVTMLSPRSSTRGYPWLDTLCHELTHLVLSQATRDRAPLWLQEGVAKRQETRWRKPTPFDGIPSPDAVAWGGIQKGLALPLDGLGPSIAMLPSPEQAMIAFAEVSSFVAYWVDNNGAAALPKLLGELKSMLPNSSVSDAIATVSQATLSEWDQRWRGHLAGLNPVLPPALAPGTPFPEAAAVAKHRRLGELLLGRRHFHAAQHQLSTAQSLYAHDAGVRCMFADALRGQGKEAAAAKLFSRPTDIYHPSGRWWSLHAFFEAEDALPNARLLGLAHNPYDPPVSCHELPAGEFPNDPIHRAICEAAWRMPRGID